MPIFYSELQNKQKFIVFSSFFDLWPIILTKFVAPTSSS